MLLLTLAALIPPPPGWTPPTASGPGIFCGRAFRLEMSAAERVAGQWPGEMFINDVYGTYHVTTSGRDVVVTEDGARTRPRGRSRPFTTGRTRFRAYGELLYSVAVAGNSPIRAITVRFPEHTSEAVARALLSRVRLGVPTGTACLRPEE